MKLLSALAAVSLLAIGPASITCAAPAWAEASRCCKTCKKGKACGDSCIAAHLTCHKGKGCACNG